jgi:2-polyprenyl-6-methoxyphenol hydroxylase-like FAD-dependent oxidoreductase
VLPHQGQGASGAIEDAEALAHYLRGVSPKGVNDALRRVFETRYKRVSYIQQLSRAGGLGEMRKQTLAKQGLAELPETLNPMQFSAFCWEYYGAGRWEKEHPDWVLAH